MREVTQDDIERALKRIRADLGVDRYQMQADTDFRSYDIGGDVDVFVSAEELIRSVLSSLE
ncbi:hypothetical protein [Rathayibacter sp. VKM Ac-2630]|uniref:hypothetical protein n=1 Tax=Rathayibacter sp. VKM Ac-2630 TaxID=1938617 RepID=UPI0011159C43|nr:hypothetical protein [Rathayibacter sp. VKM Ac-2630]